MRRPCSLLAGVAVQKIRDASMDGRETSNDHHLEPSLAVTETKVISPLVSSPEDLS
jgi:hypothetical protein